MRFRKWIPVLLPFGVGLLGSNARWARTAALESWGEVLASVYYIPVVIAAISLGARASVIVALAAGLSHGTVALLLGGEHWIHAVAQTILLVLAGVTAAVLAEWRHTSALSPAAPWPSMPGLIEAGPIKGSDAGESSASSRIILGLLRQFRTPLTSIEGAGWVLADSRLPDEKRQEFLGIVRKESRRLNRVLADVQDFARPAKPRFRKVGLPALVDDVISLASPKTHEAFDFQKDVPADFPPLRCDPGQIRQVLLNLLMNSIQASPGGGQIEISAAVEDRNAVIRVKDEGRGIAQEIVDRIFDPFFSTNENSLGLGLAVALHIVNQHGGRMRVEPCAGRGACIAVILPIE